MARRGWVGAGGGTGFGSSRLAQDMSSIAMERIRMAQYKIRVRMLVSSAAMRRLTSAETSWSRSMTR